MFLPESASSLNTKCPPGMPVPLRDKRPWNLSPITAPGKQWTLPFTADFK